MAQPCYTRSLAVQCREPRARLARAAAQRRGNPQGNCDDETSRIASLVSPRGRRHGWRIDDLRSGIIRAAPGAGPNNKRNIALIGVGGRGAANAKEAAGENIVALCDVNAEHLAKAANQWPAATTYEDWRRCLDHKGLDAVVCSTTDHTHAFINI